MVANTNNLKPALIKLIQKIGDIKRIRNWRPISLLVCFHKTISRVLNIRSRSSVVILITTELQKGFTPYKNVQEVLIKVLETTPNVQ